MCFVRLFPQGHQRIPTSLGAMSDNFSCRPFHPEQGSSNPVNENHPRTYAQIGPEQEQARLFGFRVPMEPNPGDDRLGPNPGQWSMNGKVPIPRSVYPSSHTTSSGRVSKACESCRDQKAKCSGHRPTCQRCQDSGTRCSYGDRKREKLLKCVGRLVESDIVLRLTQ